MKYTIVGISILTSVLRGTPVHPCQTQPHPSRPAFTYDSLPNVLPGTKGLVWNGDLSMKIIDGAHAFIDEKINQSVSNRQRLWKRDFTSRDAYEQSVGPNRTRFMQYLGLAEGDLDSKNQQGPAEKRQPVSMERISNVDDPELVAETSAYRVLQVRWPVLGDIHGEGLLLQPKTKALGYVIALPDADQQPEQLAGLAPGVKEESQFARHLAENGFEVLVPVLINRGWLFPGELRQQSCREWIYRQAFHMGRHVIGYEVLKVLSAVDWIKQSAGANTKVGVAGYGEGGLIAFYSSAVDRRIDATLVSGYFTSRQQCWDEPLYRNVWKLLSEFGDAEIATLIAPRPLVIEYSPEPDVVDQLQGDGKKVQVGGWPYTGYKGKLTTPPFAAVKAEFDRIDDLVPAGFQQRTLIAGKKSGPVPFGSKESLEKFMACFSFTGQMTASNEIPVDQRKAFDGQERQDHQMRELEEHIQGLLHEADDARNQFFLYRVMPEFAERNWSTKPYHPYYDPSHFIEEARKYRQYFAEEILGKFDEAYLPPNPQTRKIYDTERWTGYEVLLDVYPKLAAGGILLIPKDLKPDEQRPVVVCQHGRNDVPANLIDGNFTAYNNAGARLADQGFVVYAPYNPYRGEDRYRLLDRKANTIGKTLFSFIIAQHQQTLHWLESLPFVDTNRIAFYGLSYGGETAMRVPAVLDDYCLSICSGDFGDWTRKVVDTRNPRSFMNSMEWEMPYFNMGSTFSYAEMAYLIFPRPFMVERGHDDLVQPDEWVASEYAKVRYLYNKFNLGDKTAITYFNGGHSMRSEDTFAFLHQHLNWP